MYFYNLKPQISIDLTPCCMHGRSQQTPSANYINASSVQSEIYLGHKSTETTSIQLSVHKART